MNHQTHQMPQVTNHIPHILQKSLKYLANLDKELAIDQHNQE